ncbi:Chaperone protein dnaJ 20 [Morus notabilis]|uniref:Chaperone protein dnaJ 20 n=1 Tax=Morus notabilis TaxID=981085 RepID=W9S291_9ROSA|nr:chaperone protein dnaJ 20, chloroplastic [Morus notabilis]EXC21910.1 Chaperone protein dnaJ 20 [Morus notabilis]
MRCNGLAISGGSDSRFFFPTNSSTIYTASARNPSSTVLFPGRPVFSTRIRATPRASAAAAVVGDRVAELSFYELLGIPESGSLGEIKQAYKQLARKYHPDVSPPGRVEEYTRTFIRVQEAYETLSDPRLRAIYDRDMAKGLHLAFSARRRYQSDEGMEEKSEWKSHWQSQLSELKRRSVNKDSRGNMSWGARMRRRMEDL